MSHLPTLQTPIKLGSLELKNRIVLASMTRNRAGPGRVPGPEVAEYYAQRAGAGLVLTEGTIVTEHGLEWPNAPGIFTEEQIKGWSAVTAAVHAKGSKIFCQLWHVGRVAHPEMDGNKAPTLSPSGIGAKGGHFRLVAGEPGYVQDPKIIEDPSKLVALFEEAAKNAIEAGFDGVEIHGANGYLVTQFLESHSNKRTDEWGGSAENRARFAIEAVKAAIRGVGGDAKKVGIKLSPGGGYNDMGDPEDVAVEEYSYLIKELDKLDIGYIQLSRYLPHFDADKRGTNIDVIKHFRPLIKNSLAILNGLYTGPEAEETVKTGNADLIGFAATFIGNPDLPYRLFNDKPLYAELHWDTLYGPRPGNPVSDGYTDFKTAE